MCNVTCAAADTQVIRVHVSDLTLTTRQTDNNTQLQPFYLTVKAVTGSGRAVTASSRAIYVDVTPPVIQLMYHVDLGWNQAEPTSFQGGNSSIALYFEVVDPESGVMQAILNVMSITSSVTMFPHVVDLERRLKTTFAFSIDGPCNISFISYRI